MSDRVTYVVGVIAVAAMVTGLILYAIRRGDGDGKPPALDLTPLPDYLVADRPYEGMVLVDAETPATLSATVAGSDQAIPIDASGRFLWTPRTAGPRSVRFQLQDRNGATTEAVWTVSVEAVTAAEPIRTPRIDGIALPRTATVGTPITGRVDVTHDAPVTVTVARRLAASSDGTLAWTPTATGTEELVLVVADSAGRVTTRQWTVAVAEPATDTTITTATPEPTRPKHKTAAAPETPPARQPAPKPPNDTKPAALPPATLATLPTMPQEASLSSGMTIVYYNGAAPGRVPPRGYIANRLRLGGVRYQFDFSADPRVAALELEALTTLGARVADSATPLTVGVNAAGAALLGGGLLELPESLWWAVFKRQVAVRRVRDGAVRWRLGQYRDGFAVIMQPGDVVGS